MQAVNYTYNVRGWMTKINDPANLGTDLFAMQLNYNQRTQNLGGKDEYNGNISEQIWKVSGQSQYAYGYVYDELNQLTWAKFQDGSYDEKMTYDLNGNIKTLQRYMSAGTMADNLTMAMSGNRLIGVSDAIISSTMAADFEDGSTATVVENNIATHELTYDANGNMIQDKNKNIVSVTYNYLNLPTQVNFTGGKKIEWMYTSVGAKLEKRVYDNSGTLILRTDYISGFVYKNDALDHFSTDAGRVKKSGASLQYQYTLSDHLGNARVVFDQSGTLVEHSSYYAFGLRIEGTGLSSATIDNKFTYNGKELEDDHGLNWYHYGARYYDPQLGRWHVIDSKDEYHSGYVFVGNDVTNAIDPDGNGTFMVRSLDKTPGASSSNPLHHAQFFITDKTKYSFDAGLISQLPNNISLGAINKDVSNIGYSSLDGNMVYGLGEIYTDLDHNNYTLVFELDDKILTESVQTILTEQVNAVKNGDELRYSVVIGVPGDNCQTFAVKVLTEYDSRAGTNYAEQYSRLIPDGGKIEMPDITGKVQTKVQNEVRSTKNLLYVLDKFLGPILGNSDD